MDKQQLLDVLTVTDDKFADVCLIAGCDFISTMPVLADPQLSQYKRDQGRFSFAQAVDMVNEYGSGINAVQHFVGLVSQQYDKQAESAKLMEYAT